MKEKSPEIAYEFTKEFKVGGITIHPGVSFKGDLLITDSTVTKKDSELLKDVPLEFLKLHTPSLPAVKSRKKT